MNFSFIIPVYNCKAYLPACVGSIRAVDTPSYEIILVDDGSSDGSSELCDALSKEYPEIRVLHQQNAGASAARNAGICAAQGEYILFVDSDDSVDSDELHRILFDPRCFQSDMTILGIRFDFYRNERCYRKDPLFYDHDGIMSSGQWEASILDLFQKNSLSSSCTKIFKRELLLKQDLQLNTSMFLYEDLEFVLRYLSCCGDIWNVPKAVYHYRQTEDEGNAGRRLARIGSIPDYLVPIQDALDRLGKAHPGITEDARSTILQQLHQVLAREKIAVSDIPGIRKICRDYAAWEQEHISSPIPSKFRDQLIGEKAIALRFHQKKSALRHRIAVTVKSALHSLREGSRPNA